MDWSHLAFDWTRARAFLATAEEGSLSAAARALGLAQPTLGRQVAALEEELGVSLFTRAGRGLTLTPAGEALYARAQEMGEAAMGFSRVAAGFSEEIDGPICITASEFYAAFRLPPVIARLRSTHPGLKIEIRADNALSDLRRRDADIAIRNTRPADPELVARRLPDDQGYFYGARDYVGTLGPNLEGAQFIGWDHGPQMADLLRSLGVSPGPDSFPIVTGNHLVQWQLVQQGLGLGTFSAREGDGHPGLARASGLPAVPFPVWLVAHRDLAHSRRLRLVFDLLSDMLPQLAATPVSPGSSPASSGA